MDFVVIDIEHDYDGECYEEITRGGPDVNYAENREILAARITALPIIILPMINHSSRILATGLITCLILAQSGRSAEKAPLVARLEAGKKQTIVTYGTSLTAGGAWVSQLQKALDGKFPGLAKVVNSGAGGMWSKWGVDNLDKRVIEKQPDAVFIEFAINDAFLQYKTSTEDCRKNLENMIDRILAARPECQIILMTMDPPTGVHLERRPNIDAYYVVYRDVAKQRKLLLIDHHINWSKLLKEDEATFKKYVPDGIHPNPTGCEKVITPQILRSLGLEE